MKWTFEKLNKSLKINVKDYGSAIAVAALYKKLYGKFPEIGLSGAQAGMADALLEKLPDSIKSSQNTKELKKIEDAVNDEKNRMIEEFKKLPTGMFDSTPYLKKLIDKLK
jgi:hypothetical protein